MDRLRGGLYISGTPTTGDATARLRPRPVYTNQDFEITIATTEETKPGPYAMTITVYGGRRCGFIGRAQNCSTWRRKSRSKTMRLWWFKGEKPAGYQTSLKLFALGPGGKPYEWRITRGGDKAKIVNKVANTAEVVGLRRSEDRFDVSVRVSASWCRIRSFPHHRQRAAVAALFFCNVTRRTPPGATRPRFTYAIKDQFGRTLPSNVPLNEHWTSAEKCGSSHSRTGGAETTAGAQVGPADWLDRVQGERVGGGFIPTPQRPRSPLGDRKIYRWDGEWSIGSADPSGGPRGRARQQEHLAEISRPCPPHQHRDTGASTRRTWEMISCVTRAL